VYTRNLRGPTEPYDWKFTTDALIMSQVLPINSPRRKSPVITMETSNSYDTTRTCTKSTTMHPTITSTMITTTRVNTRTNSIKVAFHGNTLHNCPTFDKDNSLMNVTISSTGRHSPIQQPPH
jgi:hypothetical protein